MEDASDKAIANVFNPKTESKDLGKMKSQLNLTGSERRNLADIQAEICKKPDPFGGIL